MEYLLEAKARADFLWVGITQYISSALIENPVDRHRFEREHNPLTYFERAVMLRDALTEAGVPAAEFSVSPFPIETPDLLTEFLTVDIPVLTTVYDEWNRHKIDVLRRIGYEVVVLWERDIKQYSGQEIRSLIRAGDAKWISLVPPATARLVEEYRVRERLLSPPGSRGVV